MISSKPTSTYGADFIGNPPLLRGEDAEKFEALFETIRATIDPADIFEQFWVIDVTHQIWEIFRYRRMMVGLHVSGEQMALERVLRQLIHGTDAANPVTMKLPLEDSTLGERGSSCRSERLALEYMRGQRDAVEEVNDILTNANRDWDVVKAEATAMRSCELQRITQMLAKAESRRNATLKAIERHRTGLGEQLRFAASQFEAAEITEIERAMSAQKRAQPAAPKLAS